MPGHSLGPGSQFPGTKFRDRPSGGAEIGIQFFPLAWGSRGGLLP